MQYQCKSLGFWSSLHLFICSWLVLTGGCLASVWGYHPALSYVATPVLTVGSSASPFYPTIDGLAYSLALPYPWQLRGISSSWVFCAVLHVAISSRGLVPFGRRIGLEMETQWAILLECDSRLSQLAKQRHSTDLFIHVLISTRPSESFCVGQLSCSQCSLMSPPVTISEVVLDSSLCISANSFLRTEIPELICLLLQTV